MGVDARIYFEQTGDLDFERSFPSGFSVDELRECQRELHPGATHEVDSGSRYYGEGYERGSWPDICAVLMLLHACLGVGKVWYGGDSCETISEFGIDDVLETSRHFMLHGERPYRLGS